MFFREDLGCLAEPFVGLDLLVLGDGGGGGGELRGGGELGEFDVSGEAGLEIRDR